MEVLVRLRGCIGLRNSKICVGIFFIEIDWYWDNFYRNNKFYNRIIFVKLFMYVWIFFKNLVFLNFFFLILGKLKKIIF